MYPGMILSFFHFLTPLNGDSDQLSLSASETAQPNRVWTLVHPASHNKAACVSYILVVYVMKSHFIIHHFLRFWDFRQDWVWKRPCASFPKILKAWFLIYIWLEIFKNRGRKKKKEPNCVFLLAVGAEISAKISSPQLRIGTVCFSYIFSMVLIMMYLYIVIDER